MQQGFNLLQRIAGPTGVVADLPSFNYIPLRIQIPTVTSRIVHLLVSLNDRHRNNCYVKETSENMLSDLSRINTSSCNESEKLKHLLPWAIVAFAYNFETDV